MDAAEVAVGDLELHPDNPRRGDVEAIGASIEANGFYGALVVQRSTRRVLVGNHRLAAARAAGMTTVPVIWADVDDEHARRILLVDNHSNDIAEWDEAELAELLGEIAATDEGLVGTGFGPDELADLTAALNRPAPRRVESEPGTGDDFHAHSTNQDLQRYRTATVRYLMVEYDTETFAKVIDALGNYRKVHDLPDNSAAVAHLLGV